jgi:L-lactate dehydrogenase complex protein LldG
MNTVAAREAILNAVRAARPPAVALPATRAADVARDGERSSMLDEFAAASTAAGAAIVVGERTDIARLATAAGTVEANILSTVPEVRSTVAIATDPHALDALELFVCEGTLGVAENGAIWLATSDIMQRAALFLAARVVIVVPAASIVPTLHDAYARIDIRSHPFAVFVAGPSKTADIEQALVIGAHGPKELTVIVVRTGTLGE